MKIISGKYKGIVLDGFNLDGTRPTMDRVKESLFAMIQEEIPNSVCLDLFSGSGNLGIEALSNGAKFIYLSDNNKKAMDVIKKNLNKLSIKDNYKLLLGNFKKNIKLLEGEKLDIIFLDPPYKTDYIEKSIELIDSFDILKQDGLIVCESDSLEKIIYSANYIVVKQKKYGDKYVVILKRI